MTLDENPYATPEWVRLAMLTDADRREEIRLDAIQRDLCESHAATAAYWRAVFRGMAADPSRVLPDTPSRGWDTRCFAVEGDAPEPEPVALPWKDAG